MIGASRIEPGDAPAEALKVELVSFEIEPVKIGDLELPARRGFKRRGKLARALIVKIEAGDGVVTAGLRGLLFEADDAALGAELGDAIGARLAHIIAKDAGASAPRARAFEQRAQRIAIKDIIAEDERRGVSIKKTLADKERLSKTIWMSLLRIFKANSPLLAAPEEAPKELLLMRRRDEQDIADARLEERRERIIDHRLIVDRQELFAHGTGKRMEARPSAACEDDAAPAHAASPPLFV